MGRRLVAWGVGREQGEGCEGGVGAKGRTGGAGDGVCKRGAWGMGRGVPEYSLRVRGECAAEAHDRRTRIGGGCRNSSSAEEAARTAGQRRQTHVVQRPGVASGVHERAALARRAARAPEVNLLCVAFRALAQACPQHPAAAAVQSYRERETCADPRARLAPGGVGVGRCVLQRPEPGAGERPCVRRAAAVEEGRHAPFEDRRAEDAGGGRQEHQQHHQRCGDGGGRAAVVVQCVRLCQKSSDEQRCSVAR